MDLSKSIEPKSDQLNADDLIAGPRTFTIESVSPGSSEQPVNIYLVEAPGHPYRPSKSMRRVMVMGWGKDTTIYAGRRFTLYRDPKVKFGGMAVGGIKISAMSHISETMELALTVTRGKKEAHRWEPLRDIEERTTVVPLDDAPAGSITDQHLAALGAQIHRTGLTKPAVNALAEQLAGRDLAAAKSMTAAEADLVIDALIELPDAEQQP